MQIILHVFWWKMLINCMHHTNRFPAPENWRGKEFLNSLLNLLSCVDMESTYAEYSDWTDEGVPETVTQHYKRALQQLESRRPYEEALVTFITFLKMKQLQTVHHVHTSPYFLLCCSWCPSRRSWQSIRVTLSTRWRRETLLEFRSYLRELWGKIA